MLTYYDILGVSSKADQNEIKEAYRKLQKKYHPDVYKGGDIELATEKIKQVNEAYSVLSDEAKKAEYDQRMFGVMPQSSAQPAQQQNTSQDFYSSMWQMYRQQDSRQQDQNKNDPFNRMIRSMFTYFAIFFGISLLLRFMGFPVFFMLF